MSNAANRFNVFVVREYKAGEEDRSEWIRVGVAFAHPDGKGFNLTLSALPVDGKLVLREPKPEEE